ncbi:hypothetical protein [Flavobacterium facile]|uniref:hypothetical protein n=1 Tax=Flavobacterium facile TaxID=2893174 RepID=UPI002E794EA5|nr:hypothetical protein [Flavobacterium sp. T-12]
MHPILFNTEMVQAILQGRKTQTRRTKGLNIINIDPSDWKIEQLKSLWAKSDINGFKKLKKPYEVGDVLWVRENFYSIESENHWSVSQMVMCESKIFYAADIQNHETIRPLHRGKSRPSIHMPKTFARIFLQIKDVRIEKLNDISDKDSIAEGINTENCEGKECYYFYPSNDLRDDSYLDSPKTSFYSLWNSINGEKAWALNPWVWVVEFECIEKPINF